jgi:sulfur-carrier protein
LPRLVFLGRLEDVAGGSQRDVPPGPLAGILAALEPELAAALGAERIRVAVNGVLVADRHGLMLADGDEAAFLPPVSGG